MVGASTSSDVVLVGEAIVGYNFTVSLGRVSYCVQLFCSFLSGDFLVFFLVSVVSFSQKLLVVFWVFLLTFFVFLLVSIKIESEFQNNSLSSFNLDLFRFGHRVTFLFMLLVL